MKCVRVCLLTGLLMFFGCQRTVSGTYLAVNDTTVMWLQIVKTPDNHLTGQIAAFFIGPEGNIIQRSTAIAGVVDNNNVSLSTGGLFGVGITTFAGTIRGNDLTLVQAGKDPFTMKRADFSKYQASLNDLNLHSQNAVATRHAFELQQRLIQQARNEISAIAELDIRMGKFDGEADTFLVKFGLVEKKYEGITKRISDCVDRERSLNKSSSVARSQLVVAEYQIALQTNEVHYNIQSLQSSFDTKIKPMAGEVELSLSSCQTKLIISESTREQSRACERLAAANPDFRQKYSAFNDGLLHLEDVYDQQNRLQQTLIKTGEKIQ
jgi:hypothetical protein